MDSLSDIQTEVARAMEQFHKFCRFYVRWFMLYADPLSDDILLDTHEQAKAWAMEQIAA